MAQWLACVVILWGVPPGVWWRSALPALCLFSERYYPWGPVAQRLAYTVGLWVLLSPDLWEGATWAKGNGGLGSESSFAVRVTHQQVQGRR